MLECEHSLEEDQRSEQSPWRGDLLKKTWEDSERSAISAESRRQWRAYRARRPPNKTRQRRL